MTEMKGSSVLLYVKTEGYDVIIMHTTDMKGMCKIGGAISILFKGNRAHVFSKETKKNLKH